MATRALDAERWFVVDDEWDDQRVAAAQLLARRRREVLVGSQRPDVLDAAAALRAMVARWLARHAPGSVDVAGAERDPLAAARLAVADDLCLLVPGADSWVLAAGCVCFPSYWRPVDRIGEPLDAVHARVPGYPGALAARVERFLDKLRPGRGVWRRNWSVHDVPDLHLPGPAVVDRPTPVPAGRWLRSERQTLVRLDDADAVVFTIRTQQVPLAALAGRPDRCRDLAAALAGWSSAQQDYKGAAVDAELLTWLEVAGQLR